MKIFIGFKKENGFTLMELVVAMIILGIIGTVATIIIFNQTRTFNRVFNQTDAMYDTRKAIGIIRKDIQNLSVENITNMESGNFQYTDNDGNTVKYEVSGNNLLKNDNNILNGLNENPFTFLNAEKNLTASSDSVRFFQVRLSVTRNEESVLVEELIYARN